MTTSMFFFASLGFASKAAYARAERALKDEGYAGHGDNLLSAECVSFECLQLSLEWDGSAPWSCFDISSAALQLLTSHARQGEAIALVTEEAQRCGSRFRPGQRPSKISAGAALTLYQKHKSSRRPAPAQELSPSEHADTKDLSRWRHLRLELRAKKPTDSQSIALMVDQLADVVLDAVRSSAELAGSPGMLERVEAAIVFADGMPSGPEGTCGYFGCELLERDAQASAIAEQLIEGLFRRPEERMRAISQRYGFDFAN